MKVFSAPEHIAVPDFSDYFGANFDLEGYERACDEYQAALSAWVKAEGQPHALAGEVVSVPYADGRAQYVIGKFSGSTCLIHVATGDAWHDDRFCRLATVTELRRMVESARERREVFAARTVAV